MPLRRSQRRALLQRRRRHLRSASRYRSAELVAREAHAIGNESLRPARYGQNNPTIALGRKNYLFAGSDEGGRRAAIMYTLIETARLNDVDPEAWLGDVISRIADHPNTKIDELLPWKWSGAGSQAIAG
jgi:hypothetical protein